MKPPTSRRWPDRERQLAWERDQARAEAKALKLKLRDLEAMVGEVPQEYASAFAALRDAAYGGWRRPDDLGGAVSGSAPASSAPVYSAAAYQELRRERRWLMVELRGRTHRLNRKLAEWVDGEANGGEAAGMA